MQHNVLKLVLVLASAISVVRAFAEDKVDLKNLHFTGESLKSEAGLNLQFKPPTDHHFNLEAPAAVYRNSGDAHESAALQKSASGILASWKNPAKDCKIEAKLYLCNDKNTYCVPVTENFSCGDGPGPLKLAGAAGGVAGVTDAAKADAPIAAKLNPDQVDKIFIVNDYPKAQAQAKQQNKMLLIEFFGIWCPPCNVLNETVFSADTFAKMSASYVFLKLDADDPSSFALKSKFNVTGYPTVVLANADGEEVSRMLGGFRLTSFIKEMKSAEQYKNISLAERIAQAEKLKRPAAAFGVAQTYFGQGDFVTAEKFWNMGSKWGVPTADEKKLGLSIQFGLMQEMGKVTGPQAHLAMALADAAALYLPSVESFEWADRAHQIAEDLKDEVLKNRTQNLTFTNAEFLLKNPKLYADSEMNAGDLYATVADSYEAAGDQANMRKKYLLAAEYYEQEIKELTRSSGIAATKERGHNLERIYCLFKAGKVEESLAAYREMETQFPQEFTFYYAHAGVLKDLKRNPEALALAEKALPFAYGDNELRTAYLVADLRVQLGKKEEAKSLIDASLKKFPSIKDLNVRSGRYIDKLEKLRAQL